MLKRVRGTLDQTDPGRARSGPHGLEGKTIETGFRETNE